MSALKNDGAGTAVSVKFRLKPSEIAEDSVSPEPFIPIVSSSPDIFEGRRFLSFATQDKGTGIERYDYASTWLLPPGDGDWREAVSPMALYQKMFFQKIYIRAIDKSGNDRTVSTVGPYHYATLLISIIILACLFLYLRRGWPARFSSFS